MRNLPREHTAVISVYGKPLPFRDNDLKIVRRSDPKKVLGIPQKSQTPIIVIDDFRGLLLHPFMARAKESGFQKFTDTAKDRYDVIRSVDTVPDDCRVYFLSRLERDGAVEKIKTIGKLLDDKITVEGLFTIVFKAVFKDGKHAFSIRNGGNDTVKPILAYYGIITINRRYRGMQRGGGIRREKISRSFPLPEH
ncbi:MAG: hypothetical protein LBD24_06885 [Spirochaetaceae bacterium]|jgi:hypothetical protein|nr:hypothetical protein [Spirochaetaceae bacterium]